MKKENVKLERDVQRLTEENLETIFGLSLVATEFQIDDLRIDSLAFNEESKSFVIIEYKRGQNYSVIDQGFSYASLLLSRKADFVLKYNQVFNKSFAVSDIDWSQSRVFFVSPSFSDYQMRVNSFKNLPMELYEFSQYGNIVEYRELKPTSKLRYSIDDFRAVDKEYVEKVNREIKVYTEEDHLSGRSEEVVEIYETIKERTMAIDGDIEINPKKFYVAFKINNRNIISVTISKSLVKVFVGVRKGLLDDPYGLTRDVSDIGHWGTGDYEIRVNNLKNIERIMDLIHQSYNYNLKMTGETK